MASHLSSFTTIDNLIQRIDHIEVCQPHWRLVAANLARLQQALTEINIVNNANQPHQEIKQTLIAIDEVVASCTERGVGLNGVTYRDLESLLFRLQLRLAQHQADLTNDYQTKVQILSNAYHQQQILVQKVFDETVQQRLEVIEHDTTQYTIEQLRLLREKHFNTIETYLHSCTELHKSVPLTGLTGDVVTKVAHTFYQISSTDQIQLENNWQSCDLPLTRTFIQFKPDKSTSFERNESRRLLMEPEANISQGLHSKREASKSIWERLVSAPYMMSMIERDRYAEDEDVSEETIIRTKRWIVILGDPGSGKTSFARWLVRHLAQTLLLNGQHSTDYGPLRIPILIRTGEFAEMLNEQPSLTLFDYIGKHTWMGKEVVNDSSISLDDLSCALQDYIKQGQALVILDGLDEIPVSDQRSKIINVVENFVDTYVQTPTGASAFDNAYLSRLFDDPSRSGGNQLIVTSRIVGYHAAPLAGQFAHYTIRPMDMEHMKDFVDYWFFRVHQQILDILELPLGNQGENHGAALKQELDKNENIGLLDVASNSCLMSFVCSVAFSQSAGSPLPTQRILLYEAIVSSMLTLWSTKRSIIPVPKLIQILSDIATYIHANSASGLIHEEKMKELCIQSIERSFSEINHVTEIIVDIDSQASDFVRIIREDVGILAARGESIYGFLHLTFQEYFTCLKLIDVQNDKNKILRVAQTLRHHMKDPRFRVPIALALGKISSTWSQQDFDTLCLEFIQEENESDSLLPLGANMLISCSNDLVNYPSNNILFDVLDRLIIASGQHKWAVVCPFLIDHITDSLGKLRHDIVVLWINNLLSQSSSYDVETISAVCHLIEGRPHEFENIKWLNQSSCLILQHLSTLDNENNEFVIDRLLVKIAFSNRRLLSVHQNTFKAFLVGDEIELNSIPVGLFPLIICLYGGLKRENETVVFDPFHIYRESIAVTPILVRFLSRNHQNMQDETMMLIKQECLRLLMIQTQNQDETPETVDLCIATICLFGIDYVRKNIKMMSNSLWRMSLGRLKYISMILRQFYFPNNNDYLVEKEITKLLSLAVQKLQYADLEKEKFLNLLNSVRSGLARLRSSTTSILFDGRSAPDKRVTLNLPNSLRKESAFINDLLRVDVEFYSGRKSCSLLHHFTKLFWILEHNDKYDTQYRMAIAMDTNPEYLFFRNDEDLLFPFTFVPGYLQNLYLRLLKQGFVMINTKGSAPDDIQHLYLGHILVECLMSLSNPSCKRLSVLSTLITLLPWLRMHQLENFGGSLLWTLAIKDSCYLNDFENKRQQPMDDETGLYINKVENFVPSYEMADNDRKELIKECIEQEQQRLQHALTDNDGVNMRLYSACVSLARVCRWTQEQNRLCLLQESVQGALSIANTLVRLDALCVIGFYSQSDYDKIEMSSGNTLEEEIAYQLNEIYPTLPLLLHAAIFIRCLPLVRDQQMMSTSLENLLKKFINAEREDQQVVCEALSPYFQFHILLSSMLEYKSFEPISYERIVNNKSCMLMEYLNMKIDENLPSKLLISNMYLVELASDFDQCLADNFQHMFMLNFHTNTICKSIQDKLFEFESPILTVAQALLISNVLVSVSSPNRSKHLEEVCIMLSSVLHRFDLVELKACRLVESWMKWKDSDEFSSFAYHAALLLTNSDLWSVEAATIICDLLCCENDRFRQRAEVILRSKSDHDIRTSAKLGIDVLLTLTTKKAHYQYTSPFATLTLYRMFDYITLDIQSHLETFLWLERYRIHALTNKEYRLSNTKSAPILNVISYFPTDITMNVSILR